MTRTPAKFTQADVARAIRAAKQAGATAVELRPDGVILVALMQKSGSERPDFPLDQDKPVEL
jgi:hypothetical protein